MKKTTHKKSNRREAFSSNELAVRLLRKKISRIRRSFFVLAIATFSLTLTSFNKFESYSAFSAGPIFVDAVPELTPENVYAQLEKFEIRHPEIVLRQSILETGWYECENCSLEHNNIFGFRYKKKYMEFSNWVEAVKYYKKWQEKRYKGGDYYAFLKEVGYATSRTYISKLKSIKLDFL
ncbi:MAG: glucosaminidase domain-containing protein [Flavobacteriales bacterium]|nr:glucosaminidase domain-containing protein [Flavobacteriales bacterium]